MLADEDDAADIQDMIDAGQMVVRFLVDMTRNDLDVDPMLRAALERQIEIFGEAARRISTSLHDGHPEIPWRKIMGTRHILAHDYDKVNPNIVWRIATEHIPETLPLLQKILPPPPPAAPDEPGRKEVK